MMTVLMHMVRGLPMRLSVPLTVCLALLCSCSQLPRSGPYRTAILQADSQLNDVAVVELDAASVATLSTSRLPSLAAHFSDYRPPGALHIGVGDTIQIIIWEAGPGGLFSAPAIDRNSPGSRTAVIPEQVVARDGAITVPFAGRVAVVGHTPPEIEQVIVRRLADKAINPQVLVTLVRNVSNVVTVISEGGGAARVPLSVRGDRLLDVLAATGGGLHAGVQDISVALTRDGRTLRVPLQEILDQPDENVYLRGGDTVALLLDPQSFTAMGALPRTTTLPFETPGLTLNEALGRAGGLLDDRADPRGVFVLRYEPLSLARRVSGRTDLASPDGFVPTIYHLNMQEPEALFLSRRFAMRNKDMLYVSDAPVTDLQKVFGVLNLLVSPAATAATLNTNLKW